MHSPLEPPPPDTPSSDDEVNALLLAEAQTYREMTQVLLGQLFESNRRSFRDSSIGRRHLSESMWPWATTNRRRSQDGWRTRGAFRLPT